MTKFEIIVEHYPDAEFLSADGFEEAILGVVFDNSNGETRLAYSKCKCLEILMRRDRMTEEEAIEYFDFNVEGAYMGEKTPIWVNDTFAC